MYYGRTQVWVSCSVLAIYSRGELTLLGKHPIFIYTVLPRDCAIKRWHSTETENNQQPS